jgi:hypothetical protein
MVLTQLGPFKIVTASEAIPHSINLLNKVKSILQNKLTGLYFDGYSFQTSHRSKAQVIDGPLVASTVRAIWADVEILTAPEGCVYTFKHESGNGTFTIKAHDITEARAKLGTYVSPSASSAHWEHVLTETGWMHASRILCNNGGNPT